MSEPSVRRACVNSAVARVTQSRSARPPMKGSRLPLSRHSGRLIMSFNGVCDIAGGGVTDALMARDYTGESELPMLVGNYLGVGEET